MKLAKACIYTMCNGSGSEKVNQLSSSILSLFDDNVIRGEMLSLAFNLNIFLQFCHERVICRNPQVVKRNARFDNFSSENRQVKSELLQALKTHFQKTYAPLHNRARFPVSLVEMFCGDKISSKH